MTRYVIIGAGAIGGSLGAGLSAAGAEVVLVARGEQAATIAAHGLRVRAPHGDFTARPTVVTDPADLRLRSTDVLLVAVKTPQLEQALATWADQPVYASAAECSDSDEAKASTEPGDAAQPDNPAQPVGTAGEVLPVLLLLNGVEAERLAPRYFATVFSAVVWTPAMYLEPGEIIVRMTPSLAAYFVGPVTPAAAKQSQVLAALQPVVRQAGFECEIVDDVAPHKYGKLLANLDNGIDALLGPGVDYQALARQLRQEAKPIYAAAGIAANPRGPQERGLSERMQIAEVPGVDGYASSTWQSLARGTGSVETDFLGGEIVKLAHETGLPAPKNAYIAQVCREVAAGRRQAPSLADITAAFAHIDQTIDTSGVSS